MEMLCIGVLIGLIVAMVVFASGVEYGVHQRKSDGDCNSGVHPDMGDSDDNSALGDVHASVNSRQAMEMDAEVATIALDSIKGDFNAMLSATERRAIEYAIHTINNNTHCTPEDIEAHAEKLGVKLGA